jgi:hypothetical protein
MEKERNRNLMLYEFKCGYSAAAATQERNRCRIEDAGTVKESTCTIINDQNCSGRKSPSFIVVELSFWDKDGWKLLTITANI